MAYFARMEEISSEAVRVIDGDTLKLEGRTIRLAGLDAPELAQTCRRDGMEQRCGEIARDALRRMVGSGPTTCRLAGHDRYGRDLGRCAVAGRDIGGMLVRDGFAVDYGGYPREEREARESRRGIWAGTFERPDAWRRAHRG